MGLPLVDLHVRYVVDYALEKIRENPQARVREIFGDARLDPHAALFGDDLLQSIESFFTSTRIPVSLGFEIDPAQIPGVTVHLERSSPATRFLGDAGFLGTSAPLRPDEREVVVPRFVPSTVSPMTGYLRIGLPDSMPAEDQEKVLPGLRWRDAKGTEFDIGMDGVASTLVLPDGSSADTRTLEVITPFAERRYREGAMQFDEVALVTVHGHANRSEGLWLWAAVQHGLLKYRSLLDSTFGLQLSEPSSSDFTKDDTFQGENVWRRFITVGARSVWTWENAPMAEAAAFAASIKATNAALVDPVQVSPPEA
jgi:hypothetical protein